MKFLSKDANFNQVIMLTEFEQLQPALMVECIRLKQAPKKLTPTNEQSIDDMASMEKCKHLITYPQHRTLPLHT